MHELQIKLTYGWISFHSILYSMLLFFLNFHYIKKCICTLYPFVNSYSIRYVIISSINTFVLKRINRNLESSICNSFCNVLVKLQNANLDWFTLVGYVKMGQHNYQMKLLALWNCEYVILWIKFTEEIILLKNDRWYENNYPVYLSSLFIEFI